MGADDRGVSRQHGLLRHDGRRWMVHNTGHLPIRLPGSQLLLSGHQEPLPVAYTPLFIRAGREREHVLEVRVAGPGPDGHSGVQFDDTTHCTGTLWELSDRERLVLVALGQRYQRHEAYPQPLSWSNVAVEVGRVVPGEGWTSKRAEHVVATVRARLVGRGIAGLTRDEVGNALNHNLLLELWLSTTLVSPAARLMAGGGRHSAGHARHKGGIDGPGFGGPRSLPPKSPTSAFPISPATPNSPRPG